MGDISFEAFTRDIHRYFDRDAQFQQRLSELPPGVYLFGHCHIQWHYASDDGRVVLLDAGSCGLPLECVKDSIPYTILELTDGTVRVEERRCRLILPPMWNGSGSHGSTGRRRFGAESLPVS